ncbi:MAG: glycogen/starch/alpha-glucan phosphorylase [Acidobacteriota bacterium]
MPENNDLTASPFFTDSVRRAGYSLRNQFAEHMEFSLARTRATATPYDYYYALALAVKDRLMRNWLRTQATYREEDARQVYYLSLEFLMGRMLANTLVNMDYYQTCRDILAQEGIVLEEVLEEEHDMGLGNGGLGRLAACFLDSLATMALPASGYGIRYEFGIFRQEIRNGYQVEQPDNWLAYGNPWETLRRDRIYRVRFYGRVESWIDEQGRERFRWVDTDDVLAVAYDVPVPGYRSNNVNNLRLWAARATQEFSLRDFNRGDYPAAMAAKNESELISKVLYPNDASIQGRMLRLKQEYFFTSASLQDILHSYLQKHDSLEGLPEKVFIQLNDTHPALAIPELMRLLLDEHGLDWDSAWGICTRVFGYTNHTILPEALEEWPVHMLEELLPRHLQIIYEINRRFLDWVAREHAADPGTIAELSIIREWPEKRVRMANLAIVGSAAVNGVAALHAKILRERVFPHFERVFPGKIRGITNGVTPRRWLRTCNPLLASLITERIGDGWVTDLERLQELEPAAEDAAFREAWRGVKQAQKLALSRYIETRLGVKVDPARLFDSQIKRIHLYKRQLLNVLQIIHRYRRIRENPGVEYHPRVVIFAGKAAPAYWEAKLVIKLIHAVADRIRREPEVQKYLDVIFLPDYGVSLAERIIPATELSEQISTAGFEASGTGNMKFALNGALTIGTLDGANVEIAERVGRENLFIFGLTAEEVAAKQAGGYVPREIYESDPDVRGVIDLIAANHFAPEEPGIFKGLLDELLDRDFFCVLADFRAYVQAQEEVDRVYRDADEWTRRSILNVARTGWFSSDRSIREYNDQIWRLAPVRIPDEMPGPI